MKQKDLSPDIYEIAERSGVSIATVSRVMNGKDNVRESTKEKVREVMRSMGYVSSDIARGLSTSRTALIGVSIPGINNYFGEKLDPLLAACRREGYTVLIGGNRMSSTDEEAELSQLDAFLEKRVEGLVVFSATGSLRLRRKLAEITRNIPVVVFGADFTGDGISSVIRDDDAGMREIVRHLVSLGHRDLVHIRGPLYDPVAGIRARAFEDELTAAGLPFHAASIFQGYLSPGSGYRAGAEIASRIRAGSLRCTAAVCANDNMAMGAMRAFADAGLEVPGDISVTGMDNMHFSGYLTPPLTTMEENNGETGGAIANMLLSHIRDDEYIPQKLTLKQTLRQRSSERQMEAGS